jgi:peptide/nickel transport system substrate-binding protein
VDKRVCLLFSVLALLALLVACSTPTPVAGTKPATALPAASSPAQPASATAAPAATTPAQPASTAPAAPATATKPEAKVKRGGTLRLSQWFDYPTMDPQVSSVANVCHHLMYNSLIWYSANEKTGKWEIVPELVESWESSDSKTVMFHLRKGVKFHDGSDFNAEVAKWNLDRMMTDAKSFLKTNVQGIKSVEVVDPNTIKVNLVAPSMVQLAQLTAQNQFPAMLSKTAFEKLGADEFGKKPVGSGPFQFVEWLPSDHVTVKKADGYWKKGEDGQPLPYMGNVVCYFRPDSTVALLDLKGGALDLTLPIEPKDAAGVKSDPNLVYYELAGNEPKAVAMNTSTGPFANNVKLRQAALYGLDRESMAKATLYGTGGAVNYYWVKGQPGYDETLPKYDFQPEKAKQLIKEAGYPDGLNTTLSFIARPMDQRIAEMTQAMLGPIGIKIKLDALERMAWISQTRAKNFEMSTYIFALRADPGLLIENIGCDASINWSGHCNKKLDECMAQADQTMDWNQRNDIFKKCQTIMFEDAVQTLTFDQKWIGAHHKSVKNVKDMWARVDVREAWLDK